MGLVEGTSDGMVVGSLDGSSVIIGGLGTGAILGLSSIGDSVRKNVGVVVASVGKNVGMTVGALTMGTTAGVLTTTLVGESDIVGKNVGAAVGA